MSIYTSLVADVLFPLHEKLKGHYSVQRRRELEQSQWLPREAINNIQLNNLQRFLLHCQQHVPYYRSLFEEIGFDAKKLHSVADLQALPTLNKAAIRQHLSDLKADNAGPLSRFNTGGSSGEPLIFFLGKERVSHDVAAKWRATRWWGVDIGDTEMVVWGSPIELGSQDYLRLARDRLFRSELLSAFDLSTERLDEFVQRIQQKRPTMLFGYPSVISMIAQHAQQQGQGLHDLGIRVVFVTSEKLYDHQRSLIESVFQCPVANGYGGRDAGFLAHECPQGNLHICAEDIVLEIVDENGMTLPCGEVGEIVVTHTATSDFPFVRYRTGDMGSVTDTECACGRGLPILAQVHGRTTDFVTACNGTKLHGLALIYILRDIEGVDTFKIIQQAPDQIQIKLVVTDHYDKLRAEQDITAGFQQRLGSEVNLEFDYCTSIPAEKSGKFRYVVSHVN